MKNRFKNLISVTLALTMMMLSVGSAEVKAVGVNGDAQITSTNADTTAPTGSMKSATYTAMGYSLISITLNDDVGVAGYYWGTDPSKLRYIELEPHYEVGQTTVTKLAVAEKGGTYYMAVKDTSGNVSNLYSMTYCKIMFDFNDGSTPVGCLMVQKGIRYGVPPVIPRSGYSFKGWAEDKTAAYGSTLTFSVDRDKTLYAIWVKEE